MTVSAHDIVRTVDCVAHGCEEVATRNVGGRGPYANLCEDHWLAQRKRFSEIQQRAERDRVEGENGAAARVAAPTLAQARSVAPGGSLKAAAQALVAPAAACDRAAERRNASNIEYDKARGELAAAIEVFKSALAVLG